MHYGQPNLSTGFKFKPRLNTWQDGKNNTFNPETFFARSYSHWAYVRKIKGKIVFNEYYYSQQTARHQTNMRELLKALGFKIDVFVNTPESLDKGICLDSTYERQALAEFRLTKKGMKQSYYDDQADIIAECKVLAQTFKKLSTWSVSTLKEHRQSAKRNEVTRLESAREKSKAARAKKQALLDTYGAQMQDVSAIAI